MGLFYFEDKGVYRYGIWKIEEDEHQLREILGNATILTPFTNPGKRTEFLSVRALATAMNIDPQSIAYEPSGKPYLKENSTNISISHTKGYATILLSELPNVGIDIEIISDRILKVRDKFMSPEEEENRQKQTGEETVSLLLHWSAKESLFKATPDLSIDFIKELSISGFGTPARKGEFYGTTLRSGKKFQIDYRIENDFVLTACFSL